MSTQIVRALIFIISIFFISCSENTNNAKAKELELQAKELELRAKEIELKERELSAKEKTVSEYSNTKNSTVTTEPKKNKKKLRYLFFANGGLVGFYDDGTMAGCPRCDLFQSNIAAMFNSETTGTYIVEPDGSLLINGTEKEIPTNGSDGWALIDYKWHVKPTKD